MMPYFNFNLIHFYHVALEYYTPALLPGPGPGFSHGQGILPRNVVEDDGCDINHTLKP